MGFKMRGWSPFKQPKEEKKLKKPGIGDPPTHEFIHPPLSDAGPTWEGTDEYRNPADIPAHEYIHRGLNPGDYIPGYKTGQKSKKVPRIPTKKGKK